MITTFSDTESEHVSSVTGRVLAELQLYGHRPLEGEPDPRPLPEAARIEGALADIFDALVATLADTRLEPDLEPLLWSTVNLFHRALDRFEREATKVQPRARSARDGALRDDEVSHIALDDRQWRCPTPQPWITHVIGIFMHGTGGTPNRE